MIHDSFMSRPKVIVVPGDNTGFAMEMIFGPLIDEMIEKSRASKK